MKRSTFLVSVNLFLALYFLFLAVVDLTGYQAVWVGVIIEFFSLSFLLGLLVSMVVSLKGYIQSGFKFGSVYFFAFWIAACTCLMLIILTVLDWRTM